MIQMDLNMKPEMMKVDESSVDKQPSFTAAIKLCQTLSGLVDKDICDPKNGIVKDTAQWSRIMNSGQHFFPQDKLNKFMDVCGNEAPLIWLARSRGYCLTPLETEMERRLRISDEEKEKLRMQVEFYKDLVLSKK